MVDLQCTIIDVPPGEGDQITIPEARYAGEQESSFHLTVSAMSTGQGLNFVYGKDIFLYPFHSAVLHILGRVEGEHLFPLSLFEKLFKLREIVSRRFAVQVLFEILLKINTELLGYLRSFKVGLSGKHFEVVQAGYNNAFISLGKSG